jgi:hypothetical protein
MRGPEATQATMTSRFKETEKMNVTARLFRRCGRFAALAVSAVLITCGVAPSAAIADFGLHDFDVTFTEDDGSPATQAGSHPFAMTTGFEANTAGTVLNPIFGFNEYLLDGGALKDLVTEQVPGLIGDTATPRCSSADFLNISNYDNTTACPRESAVGVAAINLETPGSFFSQAPVYNLPPPPGVPARLGFWVLGTVPVAVDVGVKPGGDYNLTAASFNTSQALAVYGAVVQLWGVPASPAHDSLRGQCAAGEIFGEEFAPEEYRFAGFKSQGNCPTEAPERPFLTLPRSCTGPAATAYEADSWLKPGDFVTGAALTHDNAEPPNPQGFTACGKLPFAPSIAAQPTTKAAQSPTGLDFSLDVNDEGLKNPVGLAQSDIKKAVVTLPEGFSTNPSVAEGLEVCTEEDLENETLAAAPGEGCPDASKIGTVEVESPLIDQTVRGSLFIAEPYENEFGSLLALYIVLKSPSLGILVKQAAEVMPDPLTGQLTTVVEDLPQIPFSSFNLHFREGVRSPLASPPACGTYEAKAMLTPWSGGDPITSTSTFEIITGPGGGPCPSGGLPPFKPGLIAGTINNAAGRFSPFNVRLFRADGEQEFTRFSIKLPPGISGILAGVPHCPDAAIAAAKLKSAEEELANPSCRSASQIGRSLAGAGVGPALTYAPGKIYLAGPFEGAPISIAAITAAKVGPFDVGTVVIRQGFKIDPRTAEVFLDPVGSDPIPHIIKGVPVHARDIRAYVDRSKFTFNPTNCERTSTASTLLGSGLDFASAIDDNPVVVSTPFQAADCAALPFEPKLTFRLVGGTKRGAHPSFRAHLDMKGLGEAAISRARVTLPRSEFLDQSHIGTVCTRVQFKAEQCPADSIYGRATATTPILDQPLSGPIYLRSSEHELPDLVAAFKSAEGIKFELVGRVDSVKGGGIRNTFEIVPDAPVTSADFIFGGGKKSLLVNSTDACKGKHKVTVELDGQNGKVSDYRMPLRAKCGKKGKRVKKRNQRRAARSRAAR